MVLQISIILVKHNYWLEGKAQISQILKQLQFHLHDIKFCPECKVELSWLEQLNIN